MCKVSIFSLGNYCTYLRPLLWMVRGEDELTAQTVWVRSICCKQCQLMSYCRWLLSTPCLLGLQLRVLVKGHHHFGNNVLTVTPLPNPDAEKNCHSKNWKRCCCVKVSLCRVGKSEVDRSHTSSFIFVSHS